MSAHRHVWTYENTDEGHNGYVTCHACGEREHDGLPVCDTADEAACLPCIEADW